jgi:hypothetical protein
LEVVGPQLEGGALEWVTEATAGLEKF